MVELLIDTVVDDCIINILNNILEKSKGKKAKIHIKIEENA